MDAITDLTTDSSSYDAEREAVIIENFSGEAEVTVVHS